MDLRILFSMVSVMYSAVLSTVMSAPTNETPSTVAPVRHHVRDKRCSCATFLDKECVYFCHLDIIWVNTPERIVSYGLGNAPRMRRAIGDSVTSKGPRCVCLRENDTTCTSFCQLEKHPRYKTSPDKAILSADGDGCAETECKHKLAAKAGVIKRTNHGVEREASPLELQASLKPHLLLLQKWRAKRHHRARACGRERGLLER